MEAEFEKLIVRYMHQPIPDSETRQHLTTHFTWVRYDKKHVLVREGYRHDFAYFIVDGAVRSYYLKDGLEVNTWFAFEQEMVGSLYTYRGLPARETIEVVELSHLIAINLRTLRPFTATNLLISNFVAAILEEYTGFLEYRLSCSQHASAVERYNHLLQHEPQVFQRIPLTQIVSYLGMSRETLSRLRSR